MPQPTPTTLRALRLLDQMSGPPRHFVAAAMFGARMWPDSRRKNGMGRACGGLLGKLQKRGLVRWSSHQNFPGGSIWWGWTITAAGRALLRAHKETA
jgi:hypothetical protein